MQLAIQALQGACLTGTKEKSKNAKRLLRQASLSIFIPKEANKRMTENPKLKFLQSQPYLLVELVRMYESILERYLQNPSKNSIYILKGKKRHNIKGKRHNIEECYKDCFREPMPKDFLLGEYDKDLTSIALRFISKRFELPFEALKKFYYNVAKHSTRMNSKVDLIYPF